MVVCKWPWIARDSNSKADTESVGLQKKYVVPLMSFPDEPLGFMDWLETHRLAIQIKLDDLVGGSNVYIGY
jgi:hypothetical protein